MERGNGRYNRGSNARRHFLIDDRCRVKLEPYTNWIYSIMIRPFLRNKALQRVKHRLEQAKFNTRYPEQAFDCNLHTTGVIYAIIHLPSKKIYVGQTINSAMHRFMGHWRTRNSFIPNHSQFKKQRILMEFMRKSNYIDDFVVWPLQRINPACYIDYHGRKHKNYFRRYACGVEQWWIDNLRTLGIKGLNQLRAQKKKKKKWKRGRPYRWRLEQGEWERHAQHHIYQPMLYHTVDHKLRMKITTVDIGRAHLRLRKKTDWILRQMQQQHEHEFVAREELRRLNENNKLRLRNFLLKVVEREGMERLIHVIISEINSQLDEVGRVRQPRDFNHFIKVVQAHPNLNNFQIGGLVNDDRFKYLLPRYCEEVSVCIKMLNPTRIYMCNHSKMAKKIFDYGPNDDFWRDRQEACSCRTFFGNGRINETHLVNGHVMTTDVSIVADGRIKYLLQEGTKFRESVSVETLHECFQLAIDEFTIKLQAEAQRTGKNLDMARLEQWKQEVKGLFRRKYNQQPIRLPTRRTVRRDLDELKRMHEHFVISPCDKLSHNFGITCKYYYMRELKNEMQNNQTYKKVTFEDLQQLWGNNLGVELIGGNNNEQEEEGFIYKQCLAIIKSFNDANHLSHVNILPYLYSLPKMHKLKFRYIAGVGASLLPPQEALVPVQNVIGNGVANNGNDDSDDETVILEDDSDDAATVEIEDQRVRRDIDLIARRHNAKPHKPRCGTTAASKILSKQLNLIIDLLRDKDNQRNDYKRCFIVRKAEEVFGMIKRNQQLFDGLTPRTFDFTTLYTKLPLGDILLNMEIAIDEALSYKNDLLQTGRHAEILAQYAELKPKETLMRFVSFIINNTFIANSINEVYHQRIGIPMGTNCAPEIANLVLYVWEAKYIDDLVDHQQMEAAQRHKYTKRYIDDIVCFSTDPIPMEAYNGLEWIEQLQPNGSVNFLGAKFCNQDQQRFRISVFDKAKEWPFQVLRYRSFSQKQYT